MILSKQIGFTLCAASTLLLAGCFHQPGTIEQSTAPIIPTGQDQVAGNIGATCQTDDDCTLPGERATRSDCAYETVCLEGTCTLVCPLIDPNQQGTIAACATDTECDCRSRGTNSIDCICYESRCLSVESGKVPGMPEDVEIGPEEGNEEQLPPTDNEGSSQQDDQQQPVATEPTPTHPNTNVVDLPDGFTIELFAEVDNARSMEVVENDEQLVVFVGNRQADNVYAVVDSDKDYIPDSTYTLASNRDLPNGVAYKDSDLYVATNSKIHRFPDILNNLDTPTSEVVYDNLPTDDHHGWKYINFGPDGLLYVPIGAPCNICDPGDPYASITRIDLDAGSREIIARGVRNTVGFDWHPETQELRFTDNGRDRLGNNTPPDELNHLATTPRHFGYPFCHGGDIQDPAYDSRSCDEFTPPVAKLGPHVAALGMEFYTGTMFPDRYTNQIFIAEHGSWNRTPATGYRVTVVDPETGTYSTFADGWLSNGTKHGRPVDLEQLDDGSLLVSDDKAGLIYRIWYE